MGGSSTNLGGAAAVISPINSNMRNKEQIGAAVSDDQHEQMQIDDEYDAQQNRASQPVNTTAP